MLTMMSEDFFREHPREGLHLIVLSACLIWQTGIAIVGLIFYMLFVQLFHFRWWMMFGIAIGIIFINSTIDYFWHIGPLNFLEFIYHSFKINGYFWKINFTEGIVDGCLYLYRCEFIYLIAFSFLLSGTLARIDLIFLSPYRQGMKALQKKKRIDDPEIASEVVANQLFNIDETKHDGTVLGVSMINGETVVIKDKHLNQILLVLGTTGSGKTITIRRFYTRALREGFPLIIADAKPEDENIEWAMELANAYGRKFYGFNCGNFLNYDPLAKGGFTELKDKIITLKDGWSSDHYLSIAESYLQTTFEALVQLDKRYDLKEVAKCLDYDYLCTLTRSIKDKKLRERIATLERYQPEELIGIQTHLDVLLNSELGHYFELNENAFNLPNVIDENSVVYFALPALIFPSFSKVLGKLVANDLKTAIAKQKEKYKKIFAVFDEYSVFAGEQSLNLANMGRGCGLHIVFGTQGLADLSKVDRTFMEQITNCANTIICHRLNDHSSAELVAQWAGTQKEFDMTAQINVTTGDSGLGTVRETRGFIIHPDMIKQELGVGEAFYITKVDGFKVDKVRVKFG